MRVRLRYAPPVRILSPMVLVLCTALMSPASAREVVFLEMCDASGAVEIDDRLFAVANDEDNILRVYDADKGGAPVVSYDASTALRLEEKGADKPKKKKKKKKNKAAKFPEADLESATRLGDLALWMTSHGVSKSGKREASRFLFFATSATTADGLIEVEGAPYTRLVDDLLAAPQLLGLQLSSAAQLPAKDGGLNIEGMTARPDGGLLIGFRTPLAGKKAILVSIENPLDLAKGSKARLGAPILLELGGGGVRSISRWHDQYWLIVSGGEGEPSMLYRWNNDTPQSIAVPGIGALNPEAFFSPEGRKEILLLSDDGTREIAGKECKKLKDRRQKSFRGLWISPK